MFHCSDETLLGRVDVGPRPNGLASTRAAAFCTASTSASLPARIPARRSSRSTMGASSRPSGFPDGRAGRSSTEPATASTSTSRALP
jgi:hypothetical protein